MSSSLSARTADMLFSGNYDNTARIWEAASGVEIARMNHDDAVLSVTFNSNGKYIVLGSNDKTAGVWVWQADDLIAYVCAMMPHNLTREEWKQYIGDVLPYQAMCENLPIEAEATATP